MEETRKRINKKQQERMVERLHANYLLVRGNSEDSAAIALWAGLAEELNHLGVRRTVEEWKNIWEKWVVKVKLKARKIRDHGAATGGGPHHGPGLTEVEEKVLFVVGSASVYGFISGEVGTTPAAAASQPTPAAGTNQPIPAGAANQPTPAGAANQPTPAAAAASQPSPAAAANQAQPPTSTLDGASTPVVQLQLDRRGQRTRLRGRSRSQPYTRPSVNDNLVRSLNENNAQLRAALLEASSRVAAGYVRAAEISAEAQIRAAEIIAAAFSGSAVGVVVDDES